MVELGGGNEQRNVNWSDARRQYDATLAANFSLANLITVHKFFDGRRGRGRSFKLRDTTAFTASTQALGTAGGIASTMQLVVAAGDSGNAYAREIYLPESGTVHVYANAVEKAETTDWTMAYSGSTGGTLTWVTNQSGASITATFDYYIPVRFDFDIFPDAELFQWTTGTTGLAKGPSLGLIEVRYPGEF